MSYSTDTQTLEAAPDAPYDIREEIGRGGMSVVYEAANRRTGQTVALKQLLLPQSLTPSQRRDLIARFRREARAVAGLSHPNIVSIYEVSELEGQHLLVMERLRGQTLRERLNTGPLTLSEALPILAQAASALDAVHAAGIVHRDVKPSNVMLLPDGTAKLLDFGIARQSDDTTITSTGVIVGSPSYMAPEQVQGEIGTAASDIWALGVLAYETLTGRPPFPGQNIASVLYQVIHQPPAPMPRLPVAVQKVLRRALDKNPARRFPAAQAFIAALSSAHAASSAPRGFPVSGYLSASRFAVSRLTFSRRAASAVGLVLLLLLGCFWSVGMRRPSATEHSHNSAVAAIAPVPAARSAAVPVLSAPVSVRFDEQTVHSDAQTLPHAPVKAATSRQLTYQIKPALLPARPIQQSGRGAAKHYIVSQRWRPQARVHRIAWVQPIARMQRSAYIYRRQARLHALAMRRYSWGRIRSAQGNSDSDAAASDRLRKFIWAEGW